MDKVKYGFDGSVFNISVDLNGNEKPLVKLSVDLAEIPSELFDLIFKKKEV
jgi:hypothetical protein